MKKEKIGFQRQPEIWLLLALLLLGYFLFFHNMGDRYIWSPDEGEYVLFNREMLEDGHWLHPTANGKPYSITPPLFNWTGSFFSLLNGEVTEFTSRLPSMLAGLGLPLYSWWMAGDRADGYVKTDMEKLAWPLV